MARKISLDEIESVRTVSPDDIESVSPVESPELIEYTPETSMAEAGLRGAAQGLTFGTADEIGARAESLLTGKPYEKALAESRAEYKAGEEEYPVTSALGEIAGGIGQAAALTALTGGAAAPASAAGAASRLARLGQITKNVLIPTTSSSKLKNIATAARTGAVVGGLTGIGKSEKEGLEAIKEAPSAALSGGVVGGVLGGAVEGLGIAGKKAGEYISKGIDEGKYPELFKNIRDAARLGKQGKTFIAEKEKNRAEGELFNTIKESVIPEIGTNLKAARDVRNHLLTNSPVPVNIQDDLDVLTEKLSKRSEAEAKEILSNLRGNIQQIIGTPKAAVEPKKLYDATGNVIKVVQPQINNDLSNASALQAYTVLKEIEGSLKEGLRAEIKSPIIEALKNIRQKVQTSLDDSQAQNILKVPTQEGRDLTPIYNQLKNTVTSADAPPIQAMDSKMAAILSAAEILGNINPSGKNEAEIIRDVEKVFRNIAAQSKDTSGGFLSQEKYKAAMDRLSEGFPELAEKIQSKLSPITTELNVRKYIRNEGFGEGSKDSGLIKKTIGDVGKLATEGVNIAAAIKSAADKGVAGPIPLLPTSAIARPVVYTLNNFKTKLDQKLAASPDNKPAQMFAAMIKNALDQKDESRRAAMLNTLMQYKTFREMFKDEMPEE